MTTQATHQAPAHRHVHIPVMLQEVLATLAPHDGGVYLDGTFGAGGYTRAILESADCTVHAIDRDPDAVIRARDMAAQYPDRLIPHHGCFGDMKTILAAAGIDRLDGIVLDIGVSSIQLSDAARGFSFMHDGPLDMRMDKTGDSARDIVMTASEAEIADILYTYGEERAARRIARAIVAARQERDIATTRDLTAIIHSVLPMHGGQKTDTATRSFQALRIFVNDELGELDRALAAATDMLADQGRLVVVSFHSLEDSRVKNFLRDQSGRTPNASRHLPAVQAPPAAYHLEKSGALKPAAAETGNNPRARSARLRYAIRTRQGGTDA